MPCWSGACSDAACRSSSSSRPPARSRRRPARGSRFGDQHRRISVGPNLTNYPIINGASIERDIDFTLFDKPTTWEAYVIDTYLPGDKLAINHHAEIGATFGTRRQIGDQSWNVFRLGVAYTHAKSFDMVSLRGTYRF